MKLSKINLKWVACFFALTLSATVQSAYISGNQEYTLTGYDAFVDVYDTSILNMTNYSRAAHINAYDQSTVNVYDAGDISFLNMHNASTANIYSGNFSWVFLYDDSQANIYGLNTSWFLLGLNSHATIYGQNLNYSNGHVSGMSLDGYYFGFDVLNIDAGGMILQGAPTNITLSAVPLPASLFLFISGLVFLFKYSHKKS